MIRMKRLSDEFEHYRYVFIYVNKVLSISYDPTEVLQKIDNYFGLNPGSLSDPNTYLNAKLDPMRMDNRLVAWFLSLLKYIQ